MELAIDTVERGKETLQRMGMHIHRHIKCLVFTLDERTRSVSNMELQPLEHIPQRTLRTNS